MSGIWGKKMGKKYHHRARLCPLSQLESLHFKIKSKKGKYPFSKKPKISGQLPFFFFFLCLFFKVFVCS